MTDQAADLHERRERMADLYARYGAAALRLAYLLTGDRVAAEDLAQEAFVRVFGRIRALRDRGAFEWYLRRTIVNLANSHFRRMRSEREYVRRRRVEPPASSIPDLASQEEMWHALQRLPPRQRAAIVLRYYEDLSVTDVADLMRCPVGTVKSLVSRGLARLRVEVTRDA